MIRDASARSPEAKSLGHDPPDVAIRLPRLIVVSYLAHAPLTPRGVRTRALLDGLRREWTVELVAGPAGTAGTSETQQVGRSMVRRTLSLAHSYAMLDRFEPWSWRRFRSWRPGADGALLIGFPFSPLAYAAPSLTSRGIPYVVDVGDPWVLTARKSLEEVRGMGRLRARKAEIALWREASGAIVTTTGQADDLRAKFPSLPILVRPNGLDLPSEAQGSLGSAPPRRDHASVLKIAHFGQLTSGRVSLAPFLKALATSGSWRRIELHQFGPDWTGELVAQSGAQVTFHRQCPWSEIVSLVPRYDLALVVGNRNPTQLPSKAVAYLELPVPRLAVVQDAAASDALADYVADKPGWLTLSVDAPDVATRIRDHVSRPWGWAELRPPQSESWEHVTDAVMRFIGSALLSGRCVASADTTNAGR